MEVSEKSTISSKLKSLDPKVLFIILLISVCVVTLRPLGLPIEISELTRSFYNEIEIIPDGSFALICLNYGTGPFAELEAGHVALAKHLFRKNIKWAAFSADANAPSQLELAMSQVDVEGKEYGEDWVNLGYVPGEHDVAYGAVANDFHGVFKRDFRGNDIEQFEMLDNVNSADDLDFIIVLTTSNAPEAIVRQFYVPYGTKIIAMCGQAAAPVNIAYWPHTISGFMIGIRGVAEYELLLNERGGALKSTDILSSIGIVYVFFMFLGNYGHVVDIITKKRSGK